MLKIKYYCDICDREIKAEEKYRIKVQSNAFINYSNFDTWHPDRKKWDICKDCLDEIKNKIKQKYEKVQQG